MTFDFCAQGFGAFYAALADRGRRTVGRMTDNPAPEYKPSTQEKEIKDGMAWSGQPSAEAHEGPERPGAEHRGMDVRGSKEQADQAGEDD